MSQAFEQIGDQWRDDAFNRKSYSAFLTNYLTGKILGSGRDPQLCSFTMALDAGWGSGKTFFLNRWASDLQSGAADRPPSIVVSFDAWASDYAEDPLVAFMSELRSELQRSLKSEGIGQTAKVKAVEAIDAATRKVRSLALPVAGLIAKRVLDKVSGIDIDELMDAWNPSQSPSPQPVVDPTELGDLVPFDKAEAALDRLFEVQLNEHTKRKNSISEFKRQLTIALAALQPAGGRRTPLFILVDELDRCKPSFAVGLLEAIKHIFGVPGVCIVVATNLDQLVHTVKAVYGEGFDARTYLQRFFDAIYALPPASGSQQLRTWIKERPVFSDDRCRWAIPQRMFRQDSFGGGPAGVLAWIFESMEVSLRSQQQVIELMEAAALGLPEGRHIHVPWLALLCTLWHSHRTGFDELEPLARRGGSGDEVWSRLGLDHLRREFGNPTHGHHGTQYPSVTVKELAVSYCSRAATDLVALQESQRGLRIFSDYVDQEILRDMPATYTSNTKYPSGLLDYFSLVRNAGHLQLDSPKEV